MKMVGKNILNFKVFLLSKKRLILVFEGKLKLLGEIIMLIYQLEMGGVGKSKTKWGFTRTFFGNLGMQIFLVIHYWICISFMYFLKFGLAG